MRRNILTVLLILSSGLIQESIIFVWSMPYDCDDVESSRSGIYTVHPKGSAKSFQVFCDMTTDGGGWTIIQRRMDGSINFYRNWLDYEKGFGILTEEFWLGNFNIHIITAQDTYELRIDLEDFEHNKRFAKYSTFMVGDASSLYKLVVNGYFGDAGDSLGAHSGKSFSTKDQDNDLDSNNCAVLFKGGWWYSTCHHANLNGLYHAGSHSSYADGVNWHHWKGFNYSLKTTTMMIRRRRR